ncbi:arginine--tRNA ligase [Paenibacillus sp. PAMC21692]|uniref:arginine--tRNA ligase n=1 Tax=Paenibacillus sp. PAMC21692 TaxID=2762320 RepID=UPI00164D510D|nr:arginine--tRNA ligase [Paenibacillus sp. PAMC21692]QNK56704.1 arginine--tRNA ligase [Paenibacillus sp. PAMC21692]
MIKERLVDALAPLLPLAKEEITPLLEFPPNDELGDLALPCFVLAKKLKQSPGQIAAALADTIVHPLFRAEAAGPYLNFKLDRSAFGAELLERSQSETFWRPNIGEGKRVVIDMSSPNIAKPFGIGHLRSTMIGNAIYRMLDEVGYDTVNVNHLGDWGTQFGKMIVAYLKWGDASAIRASDNPTKDYLSLYVKFHEEAERHPELEDEAREWFRRLETGDELAAGLWRDMIGESLKQFTKLYERLGVTFDHVLGESFYNDKMESVIEKLRYQSLLEESDGALVVRLDEFGMPPCLLVKSDGTSIYATRDLATAIYRRDVMKASQLLYVVGGEQSLHFEQVFKVLGKMDNVWEGRCKHIPFGLMRMEGQKMSTRKGKVLFLEDVLNEAVAQARRIIEEKNPALRDKEAAAEAIGIGAVVFGDLKNTRTLDVDFSLADVLNFEGETGPYLQYTYARMASIQRKAAAGMAELQNDGNKSESDDQPAANTTPLSPDSLYVNGPLTGSRSHLAEHDHVWPLLKQISFYPARLAQAAERHEPSVLARYLLELAQSFNRFYHHVKVLDGSVSEQSFKLGLVLAASKALGKGLTLLGVRTLEEL